MFVVFEAGLDVVAAVSGRLETVNAHHLVPGQPGGLRDSGIGLLEFVVALRQPRHELEFLLRGGEKIGDDRHVDRPRRPSGLTGFRGLGGPV